MTDKDAERLKKLELIKKINSFKRGNLATLLNSDLPKIEFLIEKIVPCYKITSIFGPGEQFKSSFCFYLALCLAAGKNTFLYKIKERANVLWLDEEMGVIGLREKAIKLAKGLNIDNKELEGRFYYESINGFKLDRTEYIERLRSIILTKHIDIVFIDSISRVMEGDENKASDVALLHSYMRKLSETLGVSFVVIHHTGKESYGKKKSINSLRGSSDFGNQVDFSFSLESVGKDKYKLSPAKNRYGYKMESINFKVIDVDGGMKLEYVGTAKENVQESITNRIVKDILKYFKDNPKEEYISKEVYDVMEKKKYKDSSIDLALNSLKEAKMIRRPYGKIIPNKEANPKDDIWQVPL